MVALRELYAQDHEVDIIVRDLDDGTMLKVMANENMAEWKSSASVDHETVRAVVQAYADGRIELDGVPRSTPKNSIRYAPSFCQGVDVGGARPLPYSAHTVAAFLGWEHTKVKDSLGALPSSGMEVKAYADGRIELEEVSSKTPKNQIRQAPSFCQNVVGAPPAHPYTAKTFRTRAQNVPTLPNLSQTF